MMKHAKMLGILYGCSLLGQAAPTFTKDVAPILQTRCQICHRPGEAAPFSLLTYEQAFPWARAIKAAVVARHVPPWVGDSPFRKFRHHRARPPAGKPDQSALAGVYRAPDRPE